MCTIILAQLGDTAHNHLRTVNGLLTTILLYSAYYVTGDVNGDVGSPI